MINCNMVQPGGNRCAKGAQAAQVAGHSNTTWYSRAPKGALGAMVAQPLRARGAAVTVIACKDKRQLLVAAQPKAEDTENALNPEWQAEEGVVRRVRGQGKPPVILDKAGPLTRAGARTDIASIPALLVLGDTQRHYDPDIDGRHVVTVIRQVVPKSKQRGPNTPSPIPDTITYLTVQQRVWVATPLLPF